MNPSIEWQVTNLDLSRKLKELGVKQESLFYWSRSTHFNQYELLLGGHSVFETADTEHKISAFTVSELGEMLPSVIHLGGTAKMVLVIGRTLGEQWRIDYRNEDLGKPITTIADTEANARAAMLCHLIESKIIKPKGG